MKAQARLEGSGPSPGTALSPEVAEAEPAAGLVEAARPHGGSSESLVDKARSIAAELAGMRELAQQAQVREAITRTELTRALTEALIGRAEAQEALRQEVRRRCLDAARPRPLRRRGAAARLAERILLRLGPWGQAWIIARSGVWRSRDLAAMADYARRGGDPSVTPDALFEPGGRRAGAGRAPLVAYLTGGPPAGDPHPLFDAEFYRRRNEGDLAGRGITPLEHYARAGAALGRSPHPLFDIAYYLGQRPALAEAEDPLSHYLRCGWRQGLSPHPLFDAAWYRAQMPRSASETPPLLHYVCGGWREGLSPHPLFDPRWYLEQYPDVAEAGFEPLAHFVTSGAAEGRDPGPWFDVRAYVAARGQALGPAANPLVDYLQGGAWRVAEPRPGFPTAAYLAATPELVREGLTPLEHWARRSAKR